MFFVDLEHDKISFAVCFFFLFFRKRREEIGQTKMLTTKH